MLRDNLSLRENMNVAKTISKTKSVTFMVTTTLTKMASSTVLTTKCVPLNTSCNPRPNAKTPL